jgi:hypothetical protein
VAQTAQATSDPLTPCQLAGAAKKMPGGSVMTNDRTEERLTALESKFQELELMVNAVLRLFAAFKPLSHLLDQFGATEGEETAVYALLDDMLRRMDGDARDYPTFAEFRSALWHLIPRQRDNPRFAELVLTTLTMERPGYQRLHDFLRGEQT